MADVPGDWGPALDDLADRRRGARAMGGDERLARHAAAGKLDVRARIEHLLDPGSFHEIGTLVGDVPADAFVAGTNAKRHRIAELARRDRVPLVMLLEGAGYRPGGPHTGPVDLLAQACCSGHVPVVTAVLGASAGHGALVAPMSDFSVMTEAASIFTAGPPVVKESIGEDVSKEDLGGPAVATSSGLIHNLAADDAAALDQLRRYLSYFPSNAWLDVLVDDGQWFEVQPRFGRPIVCALAHLGGEPVAIVANQPKVMAGAIDADAADKAAHFISVADAFHLPLVFLADNRGVLPGTRSERAGVLRRGARMFAAQTAATTTKLHVTLRKAYGFGSMVMAMVGHDGQSATFAWPGATLGAMGAAAASRATGADAEEAAALREAELAASYRSARGLGFDELVDPRETRDVLLAALERVRHRRGAPPAPVARVGVTP